MKRDEQGVPVDNFTKTSIKMNGKLRVYDNGGETLDRYTVLRLDWPARIGFVEAIAMDENAMGFCQHCTAQDGPHLGRLVTWGDLPTACQSAARHFTEGLDDDSLKYWMDAREETK